MYFTKYLFLFFILINLIITIDVDIEGEFEYSIEYRLEKQNTPWEKRGSLIFTEKDPKNYKPSIKINNNNNLDQTKLSKECELKGNYIIRFISKNNYFYSVTDPCDLIDNDFNDLIKINSFTPLNNNSIISINYGIDNNYYHNDNSNNKFHTNIDIYEIHKSEGPIFEDNYETLNNRNKIENNEKKVPENQSFIQKYWWILTIIMFVLMMGGGEEKEGGQQQGAQQ